MERESCSTKHDRAMGSSQAEAHRMPFVRDFLRYTSHDTAKIFVRPMVARGTLNGIAS
jgi:hypothetical protein